MSFSFIKVLSICFILLCCALISYYCFFKQNSQDQRPFVHQAVIDESMYGVTARRFNKEGQLHQILHMERWVHYKGEEFSHLQKPTIENLLADDNLWQLSANKALAYQKGLGRSIERLLLQGDVVIHQLSTEQEKQWRLVTEELNYYPKTAHATSQQPVSVYNHSLTMHAIGVEADLTTQHIEFLSKVRSTYEIP